MKEREILTYKELVARNLTQETAQSELKSPLHNPAFPLLKTLYSILPADLQHVLHTVYLEYLENDADRLDDTQIHALKVLAAPMHDALKEAGEL